MPIYEYRCQDCNEPFELFVRSTSNPPTAVCPQCGSVHVDKAMSAVSALGGASIGAASSAGSCAPSG